MKTSLEHLPEDKRSDIARIVLLIRKFVAEAREREPDRYNKKSERPGRGAGRIEKIILFGSHARGDWIFDHYVEDGVTYEYVSDYDILVITDDSALAVNDRIWDEVRDRFAAGRPTRGPDSAGLSLIAHTIKEVNSALEDRRYFFVEIIRDGILLYENTDESGTPTAQLAESRELTPAERKQRAQEEFERWMKSSSVFLRHHDIALEDRDYNHAAFFLHQATEHLYVAVSMVFTEYRPKSHDLYKLRKRVGAYDRRLLGGFRFEKPRDKRLFRLLADAYVHARYTKSYTITKQELQHLAQGVLRLQSITDEVCREHIAKMES